jgi:uncharacterized protein with HEPN domain
LLSYIRESIDLIYEFTRLGTVRPEPRTAEREAVLHRMETLADAVGHLSDTVRDRHPDIPWPEIVQFRNRLAHGYMAIRFDLVWQALQDDLPVLERVVRQELEGPP